MTTAYEPGRTAYEARFAGEKQGPRGTVDLWEMLCPSAKAIWARVEEACQAGHAGLDREASDNLQRAVNGLRNVAREASNTTFTRASLRPAVARVADATDAILVLGSSTQAVGDGKSEKLIADLRAAGDVLPDKAGVMFGAMGLEKEERAYLRALNAAYLGGALQPNPAPTTDARKDGGLEEPLAKALAYVYAEASGVLSGYEWNTADEFLKKGFRWQARRLLNLAEIERLDRPEPTPANPSERAGDGA